MNKRLGAVGGVVVIGVLTAIGGPWMRVTGTAGETKSNTSAKKPRAGMLASVPLYFESNAGQAAGSVKFVARSARYTVFLTSDGVVFSPRGGKPVHMGFGSAGHFAEIHGEGRLPGAANYFTGERRRWITGVGLYRRVAYKDVYPGVDLVFHAAGRQVEFDFVLQAGADPSRIRLAFSRPVRTNAEGDLTINAGPGELCLHRPTLMQPGGARVNGRLMPLGMAEVGFAVGSYNRAQALVIDPVLSYSTYLGGSDDEGIFGIAQDASGYLYLAGETSSLNFPAVHAVQASVGGDYDAFVTKLDPTGTQVIYSTYLGGSGYDHAVGLALDGEGAAYIAGITESSDFPTSRALQSELKGQANAFAAKIDPSGSKLVFSTYLGGSGFDSANDLAVDAKGNLVIAGGTSSMDFPITPGVVQTVCDGGKNVGFCVGDAFLAKISADGSQLLYSTFLGGSGYESAAGVALDSHGTVYLTGGTGSVDFPVRAAYQPESAGGGQDAFVAKLDNNAAKLLFSTYLGGSGGDDGMAIAVGNSVVVAGGTVSTDFPTVHPFQAANHGGGDGFVSKLTLDGQRLTYSSYLGGSGWDLPFRVVLDAGDNASVVGFTGSTDFPTANPLQSKYGGGVVDAFVSRVGSAGGSLAFSTYLGGSGDDYGYAIRTDPAGNMWVGGSTSSTDFPLAHALQRMYGGGPFDAFLSKIAVSARP